MGSLNSLRPLKHFGPLSRLLPFALFSEVFRPNSSTLPGLSLFPFEALLHVAILFDFVSRSNSPHPFLTSSVTTRFKRCSTALPGRRLC